MNQYQPYFRRMIEALLKGDAEWQKARFKLHGAASFCSQCMQNTATGFHPLNNIYRRELCESCGEQYVILLKTVELL